MSTVIQKFGWSLDTFNPSPWLTCEGECGTPQHDCWTPHTIRKQAAVFNGKLSFEIWYACRYCGGERVWGHLRSNEEASYDD